MHLGVEVDTGQFLVNSIVMIVYPHQRSVLSQRRNARHQCSSGSYPVQNANSMYSVDHFDIFSHRLCSEGSIDPCCIARRPSRGVAEGVKQVPNPGPSRGVEGQLSRPDRYPVETKSASARTNRKGRTYCWMACDLVICRKYSWSGASWMYPAPRCESGYALVRVPGRGASSGSPCAGDRSHRDRMMRSCL